MFNRLIAAIAKAVDERRMRDAPAIEQVRATTAMERMFGDNTPAIVAFKIDNGYVVRSVQMGVQYLDGGQVSGFTYCKDHQAIADHIVSEAAREKVMPNYAQISNAKVGQVNTAPLRKHP